jgi:hypothetical protein
MARGKNRVGDMARGKNRVGDMEWRKNAGNFDKNYLAEQFVVLFLKMLLTYMKKVV